jgi:ElaB/YqjD/DUF883 family membrane-anchored ribosome-binding protein
MTDQDIRSELAAIRTTVNHINAIISGPPPLTERVVRLEEKAQALLGLPERVSDNHERSEVYSAIGDERARSRAELRANLMATVGIASAVGALIGTIMTVTVNMMNGGV